MALQTLWLCMNYRIPKNNVADLSYEQLQKPTKTNDSLLVYGHPLLDILAQLDNL